MDACRRFALVLLCCAVVDNARGQELSWDRFPESIRVVLKNTQPLSQPRGARLPLFLWPVHGGVPQDERTAEQIARQLNRRGVAMISSWNWGNKEKSLEDSLRLARIQKRLGLQVCVNATGCMYGFFNGDTATAHVDAQGRPYFDSSIEGGKIGCPFRIDHRYAALRQQIEYFVSAYRQADLPLDFVFGDWEIDGPLEVNRAWDASKRCTVCRSHISDIEDFRAFQKAVREKRCDATRRCYVEPVTDGYRDVLIGNYGVYPNDGFRYWYDYFEFFFDGHPSRVDQKARYREWFNEYPLTGYTMAMPVVYPWARIYGWYDFENTDYRWFYNMLLVASNAAKNSDASVPIVPFVHWHTVFVAKERDPSIRQMSRWAYQELLWHLLLRGADSLFMWCSQHEAAEEVAMAHEVWSAALRYREWLEHGRPVTFEVPSTQQPILSGLRVGDRVLVRRTDFDAPCPGPVELKIGQRTLSIPQAAGRCQVLQLRE